MNSAGTLHGFFTMYCYYVLVLCTLKVSFAWKWNKAEILKCHLGIGADYRIMLFRVDHLHQKNVHKYSLSAKPAMMPTYNKGCICSYVDGKLDSLVPLGDFCVELAVLGVCMVQQLSSLSYNSAKTVYCLKGRCSLS